MERPIIFIINPDPSHNNPDRNFIDSVSVIHPVMVETKELHPELKKPASLWYGRTPTEAPEIWTIFVSKSGQQRLDFVLPKMLETSSSSILGYVILVDSKYVMLDSEAFDFEEKTTTGGVTLREFPFGPETDMPKLWEFITFYPETEGWLYVPSAKYEIRALKEIVPDAPFVVAVINQDTPNAMPLDKLRGELNLDDDVKLIPCDPQSRADVKHVLLELLAIAESTPAVEQAINTITKL